MDLRRYDGKCVRVTDTAGSVFEGICAWNSRDYCEHEFGRREESLQIESFLFFESDIAALKSLERHRGPWGRFSGPWGTLETLTAEDGTDSILDALESEDGEHVTRLIRCLASREDGTAAPEIRRALEGLASGHPDGAVREAAASALAGTAPE